MESNLRVFARHVKGIHNSLSDSLSRLKLNKFKETANDMHSQIDEHPMKPSPELWPIQEFWSQNCTKLMHVR